MKRDGSLGVAGFHPCDYNILYFTLPYPEVGRYDILVRHPIDEQTSVRDGRKTTY